MIVWLFGFLYGIGFALTLLGGFVWMGLIKTLKGSLHPAKVFAMAVVWPLTLLVVGSKVQAYLHEEDDLHEP